jgi:ankyrin repeat protein
LKNKSFIIAIHNNDIEQVKLLLKNKKINPSYDNNLAIRTATMNGGVDLVKILIKDKRVDPSDYDFFDSSIFGLSPIITSSILGHFDIVRLLLEDPRVDPSTQYNCAISSAAYSKQYNIVDLLWQDIKIKNTLINNDIVLYNKLKNKDITNKLIDF